MSEETNENSEKTVKQLTPEQKKTIKEWISYLGRVLVKAILKKLSGDMTISVVLLTTFLFCGCSSITVKVCPRNTWEGRYSETQTIYKVVRDIKLSRGQSVWLLSNETLKTLLENASKEK